MKKYILIVLLFITSSAMAEEVLKDISRDLNRISTDKSLTRNVSFDIAKASLNIQRIELDQAIQHDIFSKRITELENTVNKQQEIIAKYEKIVAELESKLKGSAK